MRLLPVSLVVALFSTVTIAETPEKPLGGTELASELPDLKNEVPKTETEDSRPPPTIFNGVEVPAIPDINGDNFDATVEKGYWFVKHYSPYCGHCKAIAPTWQTLHEFYYTSKPVPVGAEADTASTSMNTFHAYYDFHFGSLDCIAFGSACQAHGIGAFPTFVLYHDAKEVKRFEGAKEMQVLSDFIEESLETIKPGSRKKPGPVLPKPEDKQSTDFQAPLAVPELPTDASVPAAEKPLAKDTVEPATPVADSKPRALIATQVAEKPAKPTTTPNPIGASKIFTAETFQRQVTMTQDAWFIKFYAPWCAHCQAMAPNWVQLAKEMKGKLNIGEVNCEVEKRLCKDVRVRGFPTIAFFRAGERVDYEGLRGLGDFIAYAHKAIEAGDGVQDIDATEFMELEEKEEAIFVYFYDHATTSEDFAALERLTLSLIGHARLVKTNSAKLAERYKITTWPRLIVSRDGRPTYYTALSPNEMRDFRRVLNWMQSVWLPIVPELTASNSREIMDGKLVVLGILSRERSDEFTLAKKEFKSAAVEWMDREISEFQRERQELRDAKQLRLEEAEDRGDRRGVANAKQIRINMDKTDHKEVGFAWVDGVFWDRWIRTTYGIEVAKDGEKVIINDEDRRRYWDTTISGNFIMPSRTSILETLKNVASSHPTIQPKSTISSFEKFFFDIRSASSNHPFLSMIGILGAIFALVVSTRRRRRGGRGFFRLDEKEGLLGFGGSNGSNGKVD
ncbi:thioredoxin-like protein [Calycina marina]|uniref:Thioredoxin-like protein n=1 Tax=Calycina marina TaxID=1763456 RepID=A0A9P8CJ14_9HELO|nr:thioredoxin-like protein [Calycina marina]